MWWLWLLTVLHRRRPGPKGDGTSPHPRGGWGPTRGRLCWTRARCCRRYHHHHHHHLLSPAPRSDPDREHCSVRDHPKPSFEQICSIIRQVTHRFAPTLHAHDARLGCLFFCFPTETQTRNLILQWCYKPHNSCPAFRLHIEPHFVLFTAGYFKIGLQSLARLEGSWDSSWTRGVSYCLLKMSPSMLQAQCHECFLETEIWF